MKLLSCFFLESVCHRGLRGYSTYCHVTNANDVFRNINEWQKKISEKQVKVKLHDEEDVCTLSELKKVHCGNYFKRYFETSVKKTPVVLPQIPSRFKKIVDTMERWCNDTSELSDLKGLVIHNFNVSEYFEKIFYDKFEKVKLRKNLDIKDVPSAPIIIVYNPSENVILLIRTSEKESLREQIEFSSHDMKMFLLLFGVEIKRGRFKVISLLARDEITNECLKCEDCKNCIVSFETLESNELFENWFHNHSENFKTYTENINSTSIAAAATVLGCLAAASYFDDLPTLTEDSKEQIKQLIMLTPVQKRILYSGDKHLLIQGPYGSGKSIIARKKLQMLSDELKECKKKEVVHFISHDPKSALLSEIERSPNVKTHSNEAGEKLSEIVKNIVKNPANKSAGVIVDEYDGEKLDKKEAEALNDIFEERFQDAIVFLLPQSMEKERNLVKSGNSRKEENNRFDLLKKLKRVDLDVVMRNSIEIYDLIWVTQNFLKEQETAYQHPSEESKSNAPTNPNGSVKEASLSVIKKVRKKLIKLTKRGKEKAIQLSNQEQESARKREDSEEKANLDDKNSGDAKIQEDFAVGKFGLDEAFGFAGIPRADKDNINKIVSKFRYRESSGIGHNIKSRFPKLFEVNYDDIENHSFTKILALNYIFRELKLRNCHAANKHVVLHFDTSISGIPKLIAPVIQYLEIEQKVTINYEDFKYNKTYSVLICDFRLMRGLEHSDITIIIDQDIYSIQHYLVEAMARCTNKLNLVVLEKKEGISNIITLWENGLKLKGQKLIDQWKVQISKGGEMEGDYEKDERLNVIKINGCSRKHEELQKIFDQRRKQNCTWNVALIAEESIRKR